DPVRAVADDRQGNKVPAERLGGDVGRALASVEGAVGEVPERGLAAFRLVHGQALGLVGVGEGNEEGVVRAPGDEIAAQDLAVAEQIVGFGLCSRPRDAGWRPLAAAIPPPGRHRLLPPAHNASRPVSDDVVTSPLAAPRSSPTPLTLRASQSPLTTSFASLKVGAAVPLRKTRSLPTISTSRSISFRLPETLISLTG